DDRKALAAWNSTAIELPQAASLAGLLASQLAQAPERTALRFAGRNQRYGELDARSARLADALAARGVGRGDLVGVCLDRGPDLVASLLAVLRVGAAYVPLDPAYPSSRLRFMVEDAGLALVLSADTLADTLGLPRDRLLLLD